GPLAPIPFMDGPLKALFPPPKTLDVAVDYVLAPGEEKLLVRLGVRNTTGDLIDFGVNKTSEELYGFFHTSQSSTVTAEHGFGEQSGTLAWVGFDGGPWSFAWRAAGG